MNIPGSEYFFTTSVDLASFLTSVGFRPRQNNPITRVISGSSHQDTFWLEASAQSEDFGKLSARDVVKVWQGDKEKIAEFPQLAHVADYTKATLHNRRNMVGLIKSKVVPMVSQRVGDHTLFMPLNASDKLRHSIRHIIKEEL
jgi:hypothetical protein